MSYDELFQATLLPLGYPVSGQPAGGQHETYLTFNEVRADFIAHASNEARRLRHTVQVHVFSRRDDGAHRDIMRSAIRALRKAGVRVYSYGPDMYETDTGYHHLAATCEWTEKIDEQEADP